MLIALSAVLLLRWIPIPQMLVREIILLGLVALITWLLGSTPFAIAVAVLTALVTPAVPLRTFALPLLVAASAFIGRIGGVDRLRFASIPAAIVAVVMLFFPWSGIAARGFRYLILLPGEHVTTEILSVRRGQSIVLAVPENAESIVLSGANVAALKRGTVVATIEPGGSEVRIGDIADWGFMRREQAHRSRNGVPRDPAGRIRDYGYEAWVDGAARVPVPRGAREIRITAVNELPQDAALQIEGFEAARR
jgi:hypothetical protein